MEFWLRKELYNQVQAENCFLLLSSVFKNSPYPWALEVSVRFEDLTLHGTRNPVYIPEFYYIATD